MSASNLLKIGLGAAALVASAAFFFVKDEQRQKQKPKEPVENKPANNVEDECDELNARLYRICHVWISFSYF